MESEARYSSRKPNGLKCIHSPCFATGWLHLWIKRGKILWMVFGKTCFYNIIKLQNRIKWKNMCCGQGLATKVVDLPPVSYHRITWAWCTSSSKTHLPNDSPVTASWVCVSTQVLPDPLRTTQLLHTAQGVLRWDQVSANVMSYFPEFNMHTCLPADMKYSLCAGTCSIGVA